ncbi:LAMI_0E01046g1_1 [Lachancea mirantina]|uniref:mRNA 3'-end-processing protein RNA14 n=1 Tax=Lachancea mirantina TaxID=1230905 RepID=A0A1G4JIF7_9SACH|nr:LAMI_0E01046g1_1 [Lachancea mirantina]
MSATPELVKNGETAFVRPTKREQRSENDVENRLKDLIEEEPSDMSLYVELIDHYAKAEQVDKVREVFENLHEKFPLFSALWTVEVNYDLERDEFGHAESLLTRCLSGSCENNDLGLWFMYLDYVRRKNNLITGGEEARAVVLKAFDVVATKCASWEPRSSVFWNDYLLFLEHWKPVSRWEEQQRTDLTRALYKRMLCIPFDGLEKSWNKYTQWEQDVNPLTARKFIAELSASYMKARSLYQEWSNVTKGLTRALPTRFSQCNKQTLPRPGGYDVGQLNTWMQWIKWESANKLDLPEDQHTQRLEYVYKQAIQYLIFAPEIWYDYSMFSEPDKAQEILAQGVKANMASLTLTFKLAEHYEIQNEPEKTQLCFEDCINRLTLEYHMLIDEDREEEVFSQRQKLTVLYCIYMNAMKRVSGLSAARKVFGKCRKLKQMLTHEIYIENAHLEFHNNSNHKTACKVLELGLKYFSDNGEYINKCLDFLILINQETLVKSLFETSLDKVVDLDQLQIIYKKVINYESKFGSLSSAYSIEKRLFERFPHLEKIEVFSDRYQIQDKNFIKSLELTYLSSQDENMSLESTDTEGRRKRTRKSSKTNDDGNKRQKTQEFLSENLVNLLKNLPKRQYFKTAVLDAEKLAKYLSENVSIPANVN